MFAHTVGVGVGVGVGVNIAHCVDLIRATGSCIAELVMSQRVRRPTLNIPGFVMDKCCFRAVGGRAVLNGVLPTDITSKPRGQLTL
jgi:hypothetical protein